MPLMVQRLQSKFPTAEGFKVDAAQPLRTFQEATFVSIGFSERAHSQLRHGVSSRGGGCSFVDAGNRVLVRQWASSHVSRGGQDPSSKSIEHILQDAGVFIEAQEKGAPHTVSLTPRVRFVSQRCLQFLQSPAIARCASD